MPNLAARAWSRMVGRLREPSWAIDANDGTMGASYLAGLIFF